MMKEEIYMNISEVEKLTGITKQSIRFYEKEGLIHPVRNSENGYREYGTEEVHRLKLIYILRKMGIAIPEIKKVFDGEFTLAAVVAMQQEKILLEREQQEAILDFCEDMKMQSLEWIDVDKYKERIEKEEKKGNKFFELLDDYRDVYLSEQKKRFTIHSDEIVMTPQEFTEALLKYAKDTNGDITITKEGMYPEFIYNGVEYKAYRTISRYRTQIHCELKHPDLAEPAGINGKKKVVLQMVAKYMPPVLLIAFVFAVLVVDYGTIGFGQVAFIIVLAVLLVLVGWYPYWKKRK